MSDLVKGAAPPPPTLKMDIIRILAVEPVHLVLVSDAIYGQWVHWWGRRSHECREDRGANCKGCAENWPKKWQGYLHVCDGSGWNGFLEITATAWSILQRQLNEGETLRGLQVKFGRTKGGPKGRYRIEVLQRRLDGSTLPQARDPLQTLRMLWNAKKGPQPNS